MNKKKVIIIGAGIAGLSVAYYLGEDYLVIEKSDKVGGICRTVATDGFLMDYGTHVLWGNNREGREIAEQFLPNQIDWQPRNASIYFEGQYIDYPFQANIYQLSPEREYECLLGFVDKGDNLPHNFEEFIVSFYGEGISKYFMRPFNEKFWKMDLRKITLEWCKRIPRPTPQEILQGVCFKKGGQYGSNSIIGYPKKGGIQSFIDAIAGKIKPAYTSSEVSHIDVDDKRVLLTCGEILSYDKLVITSPLNKLKFLSDNYDINPLLEPLKSLIVHVVGVGIKRDVGIPYHWVYYPQKELSFYRINFAHNISRSVCPPHTSFMLAEVSQEPRSPYDLEIIKKEVLGDMKKIGILKNSDHVTFNETLSIDPSYVIFDNYRAKKISQIREYLRARDIYTLGRYGNWEYSNMFDSLLEGKALAEKLKGVK